MKLYDVYLINFEERKGNEFSGNHFGVVLSEISSKDKTFLVAPITSKKSGRQYRGGLTINCQKYQPNTKIEKAFIKVRKITEIDMSKIINKNKIYSLDEADIYSLKLSIKKVLSLD